MAGLEYPAIRMTASEWWSMNDILRERERERERKDKHR